MSLRQRSETEALGVIVPQGSALGQGGLSLCYSSSTRTVSPCRSPWEDAPVPSPPWGTRAWPQCLMEPGRLHLRTSTLFTVATKGKRVM